MNNTSNKSIRNVADIAARIMMGEKVVHPNQQKLDVHEPEKDELTAKDFEMLRAGKKTGVKKEEVDLDEGKMGQLDADLKDLSHGDFQKEYGKPKHHYDPSNFKKPVQKGQEMNRARALAQRAMQSQTKEEVEQIDELTGKGKLPAIAAYHKEKSAEAKDKMEKVRATNTKLPVPKSKSAKIFAKDYEAKYHSTQAKRAAALMKKEEAEQIDEYKSVDGVYKHQGTYGKEKSVEAGYTDYDKENEMAKKLVKPKKPVTKGARQNRNFNTKLYKEEFSGLLEVYANGGIKDLFHALAEEPTSAEFDAEIADAKLRATGAKKQAEVAKGAVQAVKNEEVEVVDLNDVNGVKISEIDLEERMMSEPEKDKKEEIVKGMKKGLSGFKERYGDRAKEVMYATATKQAMKD